MTAIQLSVFYKDRNPVLTSRGQLLLCVFYFKNRLNKDVSFRDLLTTFLFFIVSSLLTIFLINHSLILSQHAKQEKTHTLTNISFVKQSVKHEYNLASNLNLILWNSFGIWQPISNIINTVAKLPLVIGKIFFP